MRVKIREAIYKAIKEKSGYEAIEPRTGFTVNMNNGGFTLPCAWLCPLDLRGKTGRREGDKTYAGVMYLMESVAGLTPEAKDEVWDRMENAALNILNAAADPASGIVLIDGIRCEPDEYALTGYNTISVTVHFDVKVRYCERG